jgi:hypothetical protein
MTVPRPSRRLLAVDSDCFFAFRGFAIGLCLIRRTHERWVDESRAEAT